MPGKHAPASPRSFYLSLARSIGGALAALGLVAGVAVLIASSRTAGEPDGTAAPPGSPSPSPTATVSPTPSPTPSPRPSPSPSPSPSPLPRSDVSVEVLNGTRRNGLAARTAERLEDSGYADVEIGNAPEPAERTRIFFREGFRAEAERLLEDFPDFSALAPAGEGQSAMLRVVLGDDFP